MLLVLILFKGVQRQVKMLLGIVRSFSLRNMILTAQL